MFDTPVMLKARAGRIAWAQAIHQGNADCLCPNGDGQADGQDTQPHGKNHEQQKSQPERGRAGDKQAVTPDCLVRPFPSKGSGEYTQQQAQCTGEQPGEDHQTQGTASLWPMISFTG